MQEIKLILDGQPLAKQSVRSGKKRGGGSVFYQPERFAIRENKYRVQIKKQTPKGFKTFSEFVQVVSIKYIFEPTKAQLKHKAQRRWLEIGGLIPKTTRPDVVDNLAKLPFDSMSDKTKNGRLVRKGIIKDDAIVYHTKEITKEYGLNPRIEIILIGI